MRLGASDHMRSDRQTADCENVCMYTYIYVCMCDIDRRQFSDRDCVTDRVSLLGPLKFLLKLPSYYDKLQNMSEVFHPQWETINL